MSRLVRTVKALKQTFVFSFTALNQTTLMNIFTLQTVKGTCSYRHPPGIYFIHIYTYTS